ncbi:MAG: aldo/keto reductase [Candidatus Aenigmatarchaeota archaeon]
MIYNEINGEEVSQLTIGGGVLNPNKDPELTLEEAREVIKYQAKNGANLVDTGKEYDEEFLGQAIGDLKDKLKVASKSEAPDGEVMEEDVKDSLEKLDKKQLFLYQMHMVQSIEDMEQRIENGVLEKLLDLKTKGKIKNIGIFSHRIDVLKEALKTGAFDVISTIYNAGHRLAEDLFPLCEKYDTEFIAVAPFSNGVIIDPKFDDERHIPELNPENALKFLFSNDNVSAVMVGSRTVEEAKENIAVAEKDWDLSEEERDKITKIIKNKLGEKFCRGCRYCEPCEEYDELIISEILKLKLYYEKYGYEDFAKWQYGMMPQGDGEKLCTECGKCLEKCPYNIDIVRELEETHEFL